MSTESAVELDRLSEHYDVIGELGGGGRGEEGRTKSLIGARKSDGTAVLITVATAPDPDPNNALSHLAADTNLLATLWHRAMLPVLGGEWLGNGAFAVVSERPSWPSLAATIARERLPYARIAAILREVNAAVEWARDQGIVHRSVGAESVFVEPHSDRTLVQFGASPLPEHGTPGRAADAAVIARLARLMVGDRDDVPQRLIEETDTVLRAETERGATPDVHEYIALVAMADAVKRGEEQSHETARALEQQRREFDAKIAEERASHERAMEEQRKALERSAQEQEKAHADRLRELERRQEEHDRQLAEERKRLEKQHQEHERALAQQRREMEKQFEQRSREMTKQHEERTKQLAAQQRDVEHELEKQRRMLEKERSRFEREMTRGRERLRRDQEMLARASGAAVAGLRGGALPRDAHDVEVDVPIADDHGDDEHDDDVALADLPVTSEMPLAFFADVAADAPVPPPPVELPAVRGGADVPSSEGSGVEEFAEPRPAEPIRAYADEHDEIIEQPAYVAPVEPPGEEHTPVPSIWDRPAASRRWRMPRFNTPIGVAALALLLIVAIGATVGIVRHNRAPRAAVALRADTTAVDSAAGGVAAPFGYFALPTSDSLSRLHADSAALRDSIGASAPGGVTTSNPAPRETPREPAVPVASPDTARSAPAGTTVTSATPTPDSTSGARVDTAATSLPAPVFTIHPETTAARVVRPLRDSVQRPALVAPRPLTPAPTTTPDTAARKDTTGAHP